LAARIASAFKIENRLSAQMKDASRSAGGGFLVVGDLLRGGLADVDDGGAIEVPGPELGGWVIGRITITPFSSVRGICPEHRNPPYL
jgi:hypothetical protein